MRSTAPRARRQAGFEVMLAVAIMHAPWDAQRRAWTIQLQRDLAALCPQVIADTRHAGNWHTARRAWRFLMSQPASHALVLQDDVTVVSGFADYLQAAISARPDRCLSFFSDSRFAREAAKRGCAWYADRSGVTAQAVCLPHAWIGVWLGWCERWVRDDYAYDDGRLRLFIAAHHGRIWVAVRSLVIHVGAPRSLLRHRFPVPQDPALLAVGTLDWNAGAADPPNDPRVRWGGVSETWRQARRYDVPLTD